MKWILTIFLMFLCIFMVSCQQKTAILDDCLLDETCEGIENQKISLDSSNFFDRVRLDIYSSDMNLNLNDYTYSFEKTSSKASTLKIIMSVQDEFSWDYLSLNSELMVVLFERGLVDFIDLSYGVYIVLSIEYGSASYELSRIYYQEEWINRITLKILEEDTPLLESIENNATAILDYLETLTHNRRITIDSIDGSIALSFQSENIIYVTSSLETEVSAQDIIEALEENLPNYIFD
ncbi:MAG: hypothetical protein KJ971_04760 [Firmicutes bacterium]|nr:hypothetical protein [Bacillota bacterium]